MPALSSNSTHIAVGDGGARAMAAWVALAEPEPLTWPLFRLCQRIKAPSYRSLDAGLLGPRYSPATSLSRLRQEVRDPPRLVSSMLAELMTLDCVGHRVAGGQAGVSPDSSPDLYGASRLDASASSGVHATCPCAARLPPSDGHSSVLLCCRCCCWAFRLVSMMDHAARAGRLVSRQTRTREGCALIKAIEVHIWTP